ncbi:flhB HrpN YscU SpaS family protein, partial [Vibrio parahaemolyticus V-223/04]
SRCLWRRRLVLQGLGALVFRPKRQCLSCPK